MFKKNKYKIGRQKEKWVKKRKSKGWSKNMDKKGEKAPIQDFKKY